MPAPKVRGQYTELNQIAQSFGTNADQINGALQRIKAAKNTLAGGDWIGRGATAFYGEMDGQVLPALQRLVNAMKRAQQVTKQIGQVVQQAENDAAAVFKSNATGGTGASGSAGAGSSGTGTSHTTADTGGTPSDSAQDLKDKWDSLSDEEKTKALQNMANDIAGQHGMDSIPVSVEQIEDPAGLDARGFWDGSQIHIDVDNLDNPDVINTVAHEARHAVQEHMGDLATPSFVDNILRAIGWQPTPQWPINGITEETAKIWDDNFNNYEVPPASFDPTNPDSVREMDEYLNQPIEADARAYGEQFLQDLTVDKLEEYLK